MISSIMTAKTEGTSVSQGGSGVIKGVAALKASARARQPILTRVASSTRGSGRDIRPASSSTSKQTARQCWSDAERGILNDDEWSSDRLFVRRLGLQGVTQTEINGGNSICC